MVLIRGGVPSRVGTRGRGGFPAILSLAVACASLLPSAIVASETPASDASGAARALARFDSLLSFAAARPAQDPAGLAAAAAARAQTAGTARRLFPLLLETQRRVAPLLDTARSFDTVLHATASGDWAALTVRSVAVFTRPFLGLTDLDAVQGVHLHRAPAPDGSGRPDWRIIDFEELAPGARARPRTGGPPPALADRADGSGSAHALLPVSPRAPAREDFARVTRLRLRVALRDGDTLHVPSTPSQRVVARGVSGVDIETRRADVSRTPRSAAPPNPVASALRPYLASTPDLDLTDTLLLARATQLADGSPDDAETARRIWRFVSTEFDYKLGATLFATSREALRDLKGDCSEAAVLTAALLRAADIPSRVVLGYATLGDGVWIGHAWAEAWIGGDWVGVDAALREFPAGPHRVALAVSSGDDLRAVATNLMLRTLANLDITIAAAWAGEDGDAELPLVEHPGAGAAADRFWEQVLEGM